MWKDYILHRVIGEEFVDKCSRVRHLVSVFKKVFQRWVFFLTNWIKRKLWLKLCKLQHLKPQNWILVNYDIYNVNCTNNYISETRITVQKSCLQNSTTVALPWPGWLQLQYRELSISYELIRICIRNSRRARLHTQLATMLWQKVFGS